MWQLRNSLLEFLLNEADFSLPVGRVEFLYLKPMHFYEVLQALGEEQLLEYFRKEVSVENPPASAVHQKAMALLRQYCAIGGMPAWVSASSSGTAPTWIASESNQLFCRPIEVILESTRLKLNTIICKSSSIKHPNRSEKNLSTPTFRRM